VVEISWDEVLMGWRRLSDREAGRDAEGPYEGVPAHLEGFLSHWLEGRLTKDRPAEEGIQLIMTVAGMSRVAVGGTYNQYSALRELENGWRWLLPGADGDHDVTPRRHAQAPVAQPRPARFGPRPGADDRGGTGDRAADRHDRAVGT
jgi:hypothetical protein